MAAVLPDRYDAAALEVDLTLIRKAKADAAERTDVLSAFAEAMPGLPAEPGDLDAVGGSGDRRREAESDRAKRACSLLPMYQKSRFGAGFARPSC